MASNIENTTNLIIIKPNESVNSPSINQSQPSFIPSLLKFASFALLDKITFNTFECLRNSANNAAFNLLNQVGGNMLNDTVQFYLADYDNQIKIIEKQASELAKQTAELAEAEYDTQIFKDKKETIDVNREALRGKIQFSEQTKYFFDLLRTLQCKEQQPDANFFEKNIKNPILNGVKTLSGFDRFANAYDKTITTALELLRETNPHTSTSPFNRLLLITGTLYQKDPTIVKIADEIKNKTLEKCFSKPFISNCLKGMGWQKYDAIVNWFVSLFGIQQMTDKFITKYIFQNPEFNLTKRQLTDVHQALLAKGMQIFIQSDGLNWSESKLNLIFNDLKTDKDYISKFKEKFDEINELYRGGKLLRCTQKIGTHAWQEINNLLTQNNDQLFETLTLCQIVKIAALSLMKGSKDFAVEEGIQIAKQAGNLAFYVGKSMAFEAKNVVLEAGRKIAEAAHITTSIIKKPAKGIGNLVQQGVDYFLEKFGIGIDFSNMQPDFDDQYTDTNLSNQNQSNSNKEASKMIENPQSKQKNNEKISEDDDDSDNSSVYEDFDDDAYVYENVNKEKEFIIGNDGEIYYEADED